MAETTTKNAAKSEDKHPPFFCSPLTEDDKKILHANSRSGSFDTDFVAGAAVRCSFGYPQVLVCKPFMSDGTPFPTLFWLACPYLDKICAELETKHKIPQLEKILEENREAVEQWHLEYSKLRRLMASDIANVNTEAILEGFDKTGVGGINRLQRPCTAKCLHLQTATMLAWKHPAADWLKAEIGCTECKACLCSDHCSEGKTIN